MPTWSHSTRRVTTLDLTTVLPALSRAARQYGFECENGFERIEGGKPGPDATEIRIIPYSHDGVVVANSIILNRWRCREAESNPCALPYGEDAPQFQEAWQKVAREKSRPLWVADAEAGSAIMWKVGTELQFDRMISEVEQWAVANGKVPLQASVDMHVACDLQKAIEHFSTYFGANPDEASWNNGQSTSLTWIDNATEGPGSGLIFGELDFTKVSQQVTRVAVRTSGWARFPGAGPDGELIASWKNDLQEALMEDVQLVTGALATPSSTTMLGF